MVCECDFCLNQEIEYRILCKEGYSQTENKIMIETDGGTGN